MSTVTGLRGLSPGRAVWRVAWPMVALGWVRSLYLVADAWWVGHVGPEALTALSAGAFGWWILMQLSELGATGVHARVAQAEGAGRVDAHLGWMVQGALVGLTMCVVLGLAAVPLSHAYVSAIGDSNANVRLLTELWLIASAWSMVGITLQGVVGAVFRGLGQTRTALWISGMGLLLNVGLDPLLIWGWGPVPALGIAGTAWATGLSALCSAVVGLVVLARQGALRGAVRVTLEGLSSIVRIGLPITVTGVGFSLVYVLIGHVITDLGSPYMAALGVGHRLESFGYLAAMGFAVGASTMVGQHVGAGDVQGARDAARAAARWCSVWMLVGSVVSVVAAEPMYRWFTDDPEIIAAGVVYLRIQAAVWVFMGLEAVYEGAFTGSGHTAPAMWIGGGLTLARIPAAYFLAYDAQWGIIGVWIAIAGSTLLKGLVLKLWFDRGSWEVLASRAEVQQPFES